MMKKGYWKKERYREWIANQKGEILLTERLKNKYPDLFIDLGRELRTVKEAFYPQ